jgi:hypothetical protein
MNRSSIKTWFRRNGFEPHGVPGNWRDAMKYGVFKRNDRLYRVRQNQGTWVIDVSEPLCQFDRWANSREVDGASLETFVKSFLTK